MEISKVWENTGIEKMSSVLLRAKKSGYIVLPNVQYENLIMLSLIWWNMNLTKIGSFEYIE